ncbi:hypothetical protein AK812_SmicGene24595 [Symbiodinium microadriaticum]|uniref:Uncharacterized protein n=1 Tax=Symbiodinium microadriaticum TaxID=2951 RepID=A0A1Q9DE68_SYMMI|nr:hypothetical protein AK812_SmicGene24595 [Symbiodinium microadriaticum]
MNLEALRVDGATPGVLCTLRWPPTATAAERTLHLAWPLLLRPGAFLLAVPASLQLQVQELSGAEDHSLIGPSHIVSVPAVEEGDTGEDAPAGFEIQVLLVDVEEGVLPYMSAFDPVTESGLVVGFEPEASHVLPASEELMRQALLWVGSDLAPGLAYVTAQEEPEADLGAQAKRAARPKRVTTAQLAEQVNQLASLLPGLVDQVRVLSERQAQQQQASPGQGPGPSHQQDFPLVPQASASPAAPFAALASGLPAPARLGAMPKPGPAPTAQQTAAAAQPSASQASSDPLATAIAQQGQALSLLVSHLAAQGDALDLASTTPGLASKGSAKRERLQQELMQRSSNFFLQVCQNAFKKLHPASPLPATLAEMKDDGRMSFVTYMERFGGYGKSRDLALVMHQLSFVADCLLREDVPGARELLALLLASTEQAAQDQNWQLAFLLCLLEEPSPQVYASRPSGSASRLRAFTPLVSPNWGSTVLSFVREVDALAQRRKDAVNPRAPTADTPDEAAAAPKRRPRPFSWLQPSARSAPRAPSDVRRAFVSRASPTGPAAHVPRLEAFEGAQETPPAASAPSSVAPPPLASSGLPSEHPDYAVGFSPDRALSFRRWAFSLAPRLVAAKTAFSAFFKRTLHLSWSGRPAPADVFLPLPIPHPGAFKPLGRAGQRRRHRVACHVALHAVVVAINFVHNDCSYVPLQLLARPPNPAQARCLRYLRGLLQTFGDVPAEVLPAETGRRMNSLIARLGELSSKLTQLGSLGDPYSPVPVCEVPTCNDSPDLEPYRALDADRLRLSGRANWWPQPFLPPDLAMAHALPSSLDCGRVPVPEEYPRADWESPTECLKLALSWAQLGLLHLEPASEQLPLYSYTRIFNAYKNSSTDRQIGDRRGPNAAEARLPGPSRLLPAGDVLTALSVDARCEALVLSMSDRRDYYHQLSVPWSRSISNRLFPSFCPEEFCGTSAYRLLQDRVSSAYLEGGPLDPSLPPPLPAWPARVQPCFQAVLQGDHIGVELAVASHERLLIGAGLLKDEDRLQGSRPVGPGPCWDALVIDDYFCIARVPRKALLVPGPKLDTPSSRALDAALGAYHTHGLSGSPEKDLRNVSQGKAAGAEITSSEKALSRGHVLVASPASKRLALSDITLEASCLSATSDCFHSCLLGAWTSVAMFRRPVSACFHKAYRLVSSASIDASAPQVVQLPRGVAQELQLVALLAPLAVSDVSARFLPRLFATDSSEKKGAIVSAPVSPSLAQSLWLTSDRKGAYARVATRASTLLKQHDPTFEEEAPDTSGSSPGSGIPSVPRPLAYNFEFLELSLGPPGISCELGRLGVSVGPFVDLRLSSKVGLQRPIVLDWVLFMIDSGRLLGVFLAPPCATSLPSLPSARASSLTSLWGEPAVDYEDRAFKMCLLVLRHARRRGIAALLEVPAASSFQSSPCWIAASGKPGIGHFSLASCAFGDRRLRELVYLTCGLDFGPLAVGCSCTSRHAPARSGSALRGFKRTAGLEVAIGRAFFRALRALRSCTLEADLSTSGLERLAVNDLAEGLPWTVDSAWTWPREVHINILEASVLCRLYKALAIKEGPCRVVALCDSFVALSSLGKGRSSSESLRHAARRSSMICLASGLYPGSLYTPTRLMPADHPTRDNAIPSPIPGLGTSFWTYGRLRSDASRPRLRRWASSWARLTLLLDPSIADLADATAGSTDAHIDFRAFVRTRAFDSTCGFPGEGPFGVFGAGLVLLSLASVGLTPPGLSLLCLGLLLHAPVAAMELPGRTGRDDLRAERRSGVALRAGRPVQRSTQLRRDKLQGLFEHWLLTVGFSFEWFQTRAKGDPDFANEVLICYGQHLFKSGKTYSSYSETLNMFSSVCPSLRRLLQPSWDLAVAWQREEPPEHHTAMPWQIVTAILAVAITYGWIDVAGIVALCWAGLARVGEVLEATRQDLVLPSDTGSTNRYALLTIKEPKTRYRAARHQTARVDQPQMLRIIVLAFGKLDRHDRLWDFSGSTLRARFRKLLWAVRLSPSICPGVRDFDLGSLRAGGATWLMEMTENPDYVRRRGRWVSTKVMEIYVQEVASVTYLPRLPAEVKQYIFDWTGVFSTALQKAEAWQTFGFPTSTWRFLAAHGA